MPTTDTAIANALDIAWVRAQFPALAQTVNGHPAAFLDGPGGTQVPQRVIDAISDYLRRDNANTDGAYATSRRTNAMLASARAAMADFLNCGADEIVFGPNMTTLTYAMSRAIGRDLGPGDEILVTRLDHDANVSPWLALEEKGVTIRWAEIHAEDCTLDVEDLAAKINSKTRLVAIGYASNAVGTINPVKEIVRLAHSFGALAYVDAVHYAPHGLIDVVRWIAIFWSAPRTSSMARTWACCTASASIWRGCGLIRCVRSPRLFRCAGSGARLTMSASPASRRVWITSPISGAARIPEARHAPCRHHRGFRIDSSP